ncbi:hypothetical protein FIU87_15220 [Bacillus sp. THAF10]|uniref:LapA family protein n=1 Tax=Bacillus sp. THAF10 TaxID=2587848 RepID=UPI001268E52F|nr:lipopolysaccharide assembly protein LapA domain-containing protein [Bacillus sp. THAF10]QFT90014.1 hypothetical protein FIU87_15220 [Bacillus sp. THAF10]
MKTQWYLLAGILFTIIIAVFAVLNVEPVSVNYLFGTAEWPLVLVILFSALMGVIIAGSIGIYQVIVLKRRYAQKTKETQKAAATTRENKNLATKTDVVKDKQN